MSAKAGMTIEALKMTGVALWQPAGSSAMQLTQSGVGAIPAAASTAAGAPASAPAANAWLTATSGSGRGGGSKTRGAGGRSTGAPVVGEDYGGLDDDAILVLPESPTLREQLRSGMRRVAARETIMIGSSRTEMKRRSDDRCENHDVISEKI